MSAKKTTTRRSAGSDDKKSSAGVGYVARAEFHGVDELGDKLIVKSGETLPEGFLDAKSLKKNLARGTVVKVGSDQDDVSEGEGNLEE